MGGMSVRKYFADAQRVAPVAKSTAFAKSKQLYQRRKKVQGEIALRVRTFTIRLGFRPRPYPLYSRCPLDYRERGNPPAIKANSDPQPAEAFASASPKFVNHGRRRRPGFTESRPRAEAIDSKIGPLAMNTCLCACFTSTWAVNPRQIFAP